MYSNTFLFTYRIIWLHSTYLMFIYTFNIFRKRYNFLPQKLFIWSRKEIAWTDRKQDMKGCRSCNRIHRAKEQGCALQRLSTKTYLYYYLDLRGRKGSHLNLRFPTKPRGIKKAMLRTKIEKKSKLKGKWTSDTWHMKHP